MSKEELLTNNSNGGESYCGTYDEYIVAFARCGYSGRDLEELMDSLRPYDPEFPSPRLDAVTADEVRWAKAKLDPDAIFATLGIGAMDTYREDDTDIRPRPALGTLADFVRYTKEAMLEDWGELGNPLEEFEGLDEKDFEIAVFSYLHPADNYDLRLGYWINYLDFYCLE